MTPHSCDRGPGATCGCGDAADLRAPARRGLWWASLSCVAAALASLQLGDHATDAVHRVMFQTLDGGLIAAAVVLQVARFRLRRRRSAP